MNNTLRRALIVLAALLPLHASAQVRHGFVMGEARSQLAAAWNDTDAYQVERVYQVVEDTLLPRGIGDRDPAYVVWRVAPCFVHEATPGSVRYSCPDAGAPTIHVHTPATCSRDYTHCALGGPQAFDANPSRPDRQTLALRGSRYAVVQVSRDVFVFYFPGQENLGAVRADSGPHLGRDLYISALAGGLLVNHFAKIDTDPGGYTPQWEQASVLHFAGGYALEEMGYLMGAGTKTRIAAVCATAVAFEYTQGFADRRDMVAGCAGAVASAGVRWIGKRVGR